MSDFIIDLVSTSFHKPSQEVRPQPQQTSSNPMPVQLLQCRLGKTSAPCADDCMLSKGTAESISGGA